MSNLFKPIRDLSSYALLVNSLLLTGMIVYALLFQEQVKNNTFISSAATVSLFVELFFGVVLPLFVLMPRRRNNDLR